MCVLFCLLFFFFFNDTPTTEIYTLSLHDALPIYTAAKTGSVEVKIKAATVSTGDAKHEAGSYGAKKDRKSTRLNSSHRCISYAVFCLKKKKSYSLTTAAQQR